MKTRIFNYTKGILLVLVFIGFSDNIFGEYIHKRPREIIQPNGDKLQVFLTGDEYHHWLHDANNFTIVQNAQGYYVYAKMESGDLVPTDYAVGSVNPSMVGLTPGVNISTNKIKEIRAKRGGDRQAASFFGKIVEDRKISGAKFGAPLLSQLVIFVRFSDQTEFPEEKALYEGYFDTDSISLKDYFLWNSYNQLTINSKFLGGTATNIVSYQDPHPRSYYEPKTATNPNGYDESERSSREILLWQNAINAMKSLVPANLDLDGNDDGKIDNICFVVRGQSSDKWAAILWPHVSSVPNTITINGAVMASYICMMEQPFDVKTLCHEMGHVLGAPDFYRYTEGFTPIGDWELMAMPQYFPQSMSAYVKYKYMGFITDIPEITSSGYYNLAPLGDYPQAYKIPSTKAGEYFVVEYRKKTEWGNYESQIDGSGLLIYRVNSAAGGNAGGPPDELYLYRSNETLYDAEFCEEEGRTQFTDYTTPYAFMSDESLGHLNITEIGMAGDVIVFYYKKPHCLATNNKVISYSSTSTIPNYSEAIELINSVGTVVVASGQDKTFNSTKVVLSPGFKAVSGSKFRAITPNCTPYQTIPPAARLLSADGYNEIGSGDLQGLNDGVQAQKFEVYPNPANDKLFLKILDGHLQGFEKIEVFSVSGALVFAQNILNKDGENTVDIHGLENGMYYVKLNANKESYAQKFVVVNK